jgi:hypothetical protein
MKEASLPYQVLAESLERGGSKSQDVKGLMEELDVVVQLIKVGHQQCFAHSKGNNAVLPYVTGSKRRPWQCAAEAQAAAG